MDATVAGVSGDELLPEQNQNPVQQPENPRDAAMNRIAQEINDERDEESGITREHQVDDELVDDAQPAPFVQRDGKYYTTVKIDNEDREVDFDQLKAVAQKNWAADKRMNEAAQAYKYLQGESLRLQNESKRIAEEKQQLEAMRNQQKQPDQPSNTDADDVVNDEEYADLVANSVIDGDLDQFKDFVRKAIGAKQQTQPSPSVDPDAIANQVMTAIHQQEQKKQLRGAWQSFNESFPEIVRDDGLFTLASKQADAIHKALPHLSYQDVFQRAGHMVRERYIQPSQDINATLAQKRAAPAAISGTNQRPPQQRRAAPPPTTAQVIAQMRQSRGQA